MPSLAETFPAYQIASEECAKAKAEAHALLLDVLHQREPRWLSLVGRSGVGKTFLSSCLRHEIRICRPRWSCQLWSWERVVDIMRGGDFGIIEHLCTLDFLILDDIGAAYESALSKSKLLTIAERRLGKWTVWTSNLMFDQIGDQLDVRISSRMVRGGSRVVAFRKTKDYCLTNYQKQIPTN